MYWHWSAGSLLGGYAWIYMFVVGWARKTANSIKYFRVYMQDLFIACDELGHCNWLIGHFTSLVGYMYSSWHLVFFGWSALLVIRLALCGT